MLSERDERWNTFISDVCFRDESTLSDIQRKAVLCFWYDAEMNNGGFSGYSDVYPDTDLKELEDGVYDSLLMFWLSMVVTETGPDDNRAEKFLSMNERLGHSEQDVEQRVQKIQAMMNFFGQ